MNEYDEWNLASIEAELERDNQPDLSGCAGCGGCLQFLLLMFVGLLMFAVFSIFLSQK